MISNSYLQRGNKPFREAEKIGSKLVVTALRNTGLFFYLFFIILLFFIYL